MKQICITPREGHDLDAELNDAVRCLNNAGISPRTARPQSAYGIIWVDDTELAAALNVLRDAGFHASEFAG